MKRGAVRLGLAGLLTAGLMVATGPFESSTSLAFADSHKKAEAAKEALKVKGKITNISQKAKTIALTKKDKSFFLLKFTDDTELKGVKSSRDFKVGEAILVKYKTVDGENIATSLQKALVKLPKGTKEVKTDELAKMLSDKSDLVLIDARPPVKYGESHIEQAISIPYSKIVKMGDKADQLLTEYKGKQLIFYCGGPT